MLAAILVVYGSISAPFVYGFTWLSAMAYGIVAATSGESYYLTFALCGLVAVMTYACGKALRDAASAKKTADKK